MKIKTIIISMVLVSWMGFGGFAQEVKKEKVSGGTGYLMTGYSAFNVSSVNVELGNYGYPELTGGSFSFGGGGHFVYRNWMLGGEGHGLSNSDASDGEYELNLKGGYGFFNAGYIIYHDRTLNLYPLVGIGGGGATVSVTRKANIPVTFDDLLSDPARQSQITNGGFLMNFSIGADFFVFAEKTEDATGGWLIGLKAGYVLQLNDSSWNFEGQAIQGSPAGCISGPYVRLTIGGGALRKD